MISTFEKGDWIAGRIWAMGTHPVSFLVPIHLLNMAECKRVFSHWVDIVSWMNLMNWVNWMNWVNRETVVRWKTWGFPCHLRGDLFVDTIGELAGEMPALLFDVGAEFRKNHFVPSKLASPLNNSNWPKIMNIWRQSLFASVGPLTKTGALTGLGALHFLGPILFHFNWLLIEWTLATKRGGGIFGDLSRMHW